METREQTIGLADQTIARYERASDEVGLSRALGSDWRHALPYDPRGTVWSDARRAVRAFSGLREALATLSRKYAPMGTWGQE